MNLRAVTKTLLVDIYLCSLNKGTFGNNLDASSRVRKVGDSLCLRSSELKALQISMIKRGLIETANGTFSKLTTKGRKMITVVMAGGSFDVIHPGHLETLKKAKELGDILIVSVARDATFFKNKKRRAIHPEEQRRELVAAVKFVDATILGSEKNIFETVRFLEPDIIALGYDQTHTEKAVKEGAKKKGIDVSIVRIESSVPEIKTSRILSRL